MTTDAVSVLALQVKSFTLDDPSNQRRLPGCSVSTPATAAGRGVGVGVAIGVGVSGAAGEGLATGTRVAVDSGSVG